MINETIKDYQILKFSLYGFLKNLRFFEPFLIVYFALGGLSLFQIGLLYSVREIIIYLFEVPSGVFADRYGKKTELVICFLFYIVSFIVFFFANNFIGFMLGIMIYGLGEAFRSGTHKAIIMAYIDIKEIKESKSKIYGKTRSFSMIGSMVSSIIAIFLVLNLPSISWLFLIAIVPYILDLLLILSYPNYLNERIESRFSFKEFLKQNIDSVKYVFTDKKVLNLLIGSSSYNAGFKTIKDYIQPIIISFTLSFVIFTNLSAEENTNIYLGVIYAFIYLLSAVASFNAHRLSYYFSKDKIIKMMWVLSGTSILLLSFFIDNLYILIIVFLLIYVFLNIRKPFMIEKIGDEVQSDRRASVLSIDSQFTSILIIIFAPILGLISDVYSISTMLFIVGIVMISIYFAKYFRSLFIKSYM